MPRVLLRGVEHCLEKGAISAYRPHANSEYPEVQLGRHTAGANVRRGEGNNPDRQLRSQITTKWETMWEGSDSQDVGLEAAII